MHRALETGFRTGKIRLVSQGSTYGYISDVINTNGGYAVTPDASAALTVVLKASKHLHGIEVHHGVSSRSSTTRLFLAYLLSCIGHLIRWARYAWDVVVPQAFSEHHQTRSSVSTPM